MYEHDGWMWLGGGLMWLFWLLIIVAVVLLVRFIIVGGLSSSRTDSALEILKNATLAAKSTRRIMSSARKIFFLEVCMLLNLINNH